MRKIILASGSPRRKELLEQFGLEFEVFPANIAEHTEESDPAKVVEDLAYQKAAWVCEQVKKNKVAAGEDLSRLVVLGSDTVVAYENRILGKPKDEEEAFAMLSMLSGQTHQVATGAALLFPNGEHAPILFSEVTKVTMYEVSAEEIRDYIATGEPMDKAGAYGIQARGGALVEKIDGDYNTVVGLPAAHIYRILKALEAEERRTSEKEEQR